MFINTSSHFLAFLQLQFYSYITIDVKLLASKGRRPFGGERADKRPVGLLEVKDLEKSRKMSL